VAYLGLDVSAGIAAALTATGGLLIRHRAGFQICPDEPEGAKCFLARSLLDTAVDWARTGTPRPVPVKTPLDLAVDQLLAAQRTPAHVERSADLADRADRTARCPAYDLVHG
jgi:hypothetical protein